MCHYLKHGPIVQVVFINLHFVRRILPQVVQRTHQLIIRSGTANTRVANAAGNDFLDQPVPFLINDQWDKLVSMFEKKSFIQMIKL